MKVEKGEFLIDGRKSAMMTMRQRPLAVRSRLELWQLGRHGCQQQTAWWAARQGGWYLLTAELL